VRVAGLYSEDGIQKKNPEGEEERKNRWEMVPNNGMRNGVK
jgi:hypothetical protein